ncbi:hypothetical protein N7448_009988 [Penicillium atrosanguineum]|uniref:Transcription factor domain-containing protein n=1 Tax=Penicillium atrosanguineum TaxID=1132637 RepID=A0A9W9KTN0_9EURO|nr:Peptidase M20D amidohydrolase predicted [Penicillium atrosanguineum]KAJ5118273.1 hypothetical protein N7526_009910 [Penicillium atrosanguineum]KAJ5119319.1 hypothetical protein N7448_009988 [Penicillium atrosanguineum]KAJ5296311.1 Peptidase M20D amidohydrolase predicted [Penicillium atrosanguineum]KAJ5299080.1 hypothetical protein N7476_010637 [Penicillium atrosanguineum]
MPPVRSEPRSMPNRRSDATKVISARIRELETRLALYEPQFTTGNPITPFNYLNEDSTAQRISTERDIGSSQNFGYRVQTLFEQRSNQPPEPRSRPFKSTRASLFPEDLPPLQPRISRPGWSLADLELPPEEDAFQLLDTVLFYFEEPQHLFDARYISDRLTAFYENREEQLRRPDIRVVQILVILALGKLIRGEQDILELPPGTRLFKYALDLLPTPDELRSQGVAGIEALAIIAIYLQNGDRTDDAATYSIILTLRPIVLHLTKSILDREITFPESHHSFQGLTGTCIEAARWCLELMIVARKENMIAIFGFFDLEAIFSAGFILLMGEMIDAASAGHGTSSVCLKPSPGVYEAMDLLRYLASFQNRAAEARLQQMLRLSTRIPSLVDAVSLREEAKTYDRLPQLDTSEVEGTAAEIDSGESNSLDFRMAGTSMEGLAQRFLPIHFPTDLQDMHSVYHDQDFVLTGADIADFEELQRQLFGPEVQS